MQSPCNLLPISIHAISFQSPIHAISVQVLAVEAWGEETRALLLQCQLEYETQRKKQREEGAARDAEAEEKDRKVGLCTDVQGACAGCMHVWEGQQGLSVHSCVRSLRVVCVCKRNGGCFY